MAGVILPNIQKEKNFYFLLMVSALKAAKTPISARKNGEKRRKLFKKWSVVSEKQLDAHENEHEHETTAEIVQHLREGVMWSTEAGDCCVLRKKVY